MRLTKSCRMCTVRNRAATLIGGVLFTCVLLMIVNIYELRVMTSTHFALHGMGPVGRLDPLDKAKKPTVWVTGKKLNSGYLDRVYTVFSRIGYQRNNGPLDGFDWDVMWAHDYPFTQFSSFLNALKPYQKINHFPGSGHITNKVNLATSKTIPHIPKAFKIPKDKEEFLKYSKDHPDYLWVQKSNNHRGIKIKSVEELDLMHENTFIQQYVDRPYLINGHRFDIGIYIVLTSINPLRIYAFSNDWLIRFCAEKYYPFDQTIIRKYVVTDDYKPPWEIPDLDKYYTEADVSRKEALLKHLKDEGRNGEKLAQDIYKTIVSVFLENENHLIKACAQYPSMRHFFELMRFDFVLDDDLNVYLMEVNMSPNLSSGHFPQNKQLYEQVIYGMLNLVGVARSMDIDISQSNTDEMNMQVSNREIHAYLEECTSGLCQNSCSHEVCKLCKNCLNSEQVSVLKTSHQEHINRHSYRRLFPRLFKSKRDAQLWVTEKDDSFKNLSSINKWMTMWFRGKCSKDLSWCS